MFVELGKIVGVWGVKGWVKLHSYTRQRADISQYPTWYLKVPRSELPPSPIAVLNCREQGQGIVAQLHGIDDRDQAQLLAGQIIMVRQSDLPELPQGEYYWQQLIGLSVSNASQLIGTVSSMLETGANDVLVCNSANEGEPEILIPYTDEVVLNVDLELGAMTVDWDPSYLLD